MVIQNGTDKVAALFKKAVRKVNIVWTSSKKGNREEVMDFHLCWFTVKHNFSFKK